MRASGSAQFAEEAKVVVEEEEKKGGAASTTEGDDGSDGDANEGAQAKKKVKTKAQIEAEALAGNLYGALEMHDKTWNATEKEITKAFRNMAIKFHPDKLGKDPTKAQKTLWLKIQEAYDTLMDPAKRRKYDSSLPFDEKIPEEGSFTDETFYKVFAKCFELNSRWTAERPLPNFGIDGTPMNKVKQFYKFWDNFKSWREFSQYDEYDTEEAHDRYERRYMQNENKKLNAKYVKLER